MKTSEAPKTVTLNNEQKLYVIPCGGGYSTYGFEHLFNKRAKIAKELNRPDLAMGEMGTMDVYNEYEALCSIAQARYAANKNNRLESGLNEKLKGLEGKRVEVVYTNGEKERFWVGRSTGWIPCHLVIKKTNSMGGVSVTSDENIKSVKVVRTR